jgi:hypothetical protein
LSQPVFQLWRSKNTLRPVFRPVFCCFPLFSSLLSLKRRKWPGLAARKISEKVTEERPSQEYLKKKKVILINDWPAYSPDLSPIENIWYVLNQEIAKLHPQTDKELMAAAKKAWEENSNEGHERPRQVVPGKVASTAG